MTNSPSGFLQSEATFARNLLGYARRSRQIKLRPNLFANRARHLRGRRQVGIVFRNVEVRFVEGQGFDQVGVTLEGFPDLARDSPIARKIRWQEHGARAEVFRSNRWHCRPHAKSSGFVASSADNGALTAPRYYDGLAAQLRIVPLLHGRIERVHVDMNDRLVASPARGFYVVIPPEYRSLGSLLADPCLPALMDWRKTRYYAGLLTAAQYRGAAHHRPQVFQAMVEKNERPIDVGSIRVRFVARKLLKRVPVQSFNTPRGTLQVSTAEATAIDLAGCPQHAGGLDQVATVLSEIAEKIDAKRLDLAARSAPLPWAQRLGYLLELVGAKEQARALREYVHRHARDWTPLVPGASRARAPRNRLAALRECTRGTGSMIPRDYITAWRAKVAWVEDSHVEQDLIVSRALVELFSERELASTLAFRGGTALHKLHFRPAARYSEDVDLVQVEAGAIGSCDRVAQDA